MAIPHFWYFFEHDDKSGSISGIFGKDVDSFPSIFADDWVFWECFFWTDAFEVVCTMAKVWRRYFSTCSWSIILTILSLNEGSIMLPGTYTVVMVRFATGMWNGTFRQSFRIPFYNIMSLLQKTVFVSWRESRSFSLRTTFSIRMFSGFRDVLLATRSSASVSMVATFGSAA